MASRTAAVRAVLGFALLALAPPPPVLAAVSSPDSAWSDTFGLPVVDHSVAAILEFGDDLIAAGRFTQAGGAIRAHVARWDGSAWQPMGFGLGDDVLALAIYQGSLVAGGTFGFAGGRAANGLARWDGSAWQPFASTVPFVGTVMSLVARDSLLIVGGEIVGDAQGSPVRNIVAWDGHAWSALGEGFDAAVRALAYHGDTLVAGGRFRASGATSMLCVARWTGAAWAPMGSGLDIDFGRAEVLGLANFRGELYAAGYFRRSEGAPVSSVGRWSGASWDSLPGVYEGVAEAIASVGDSLWIGGVFYTGEAGTQPLMFWTGDTARIGDPPGLSHVTAIGEWRGGVAIAGSLRQSSYAPPYGVSWRDGVRWVALEAWQPDMHGLTGPVYALAMFRGRLVAGGEIQFAGDPPGLREMNGVAMWDGDHWVRLGDTYGWDVRSLAVYRGELIAGGWLRSDTDPAISNIARWDGVAWRSLGTGMDQGVASLLSVDDQLYAGGWFTSADGSPAQHAARWNGTAWSALGAGFEGDVVRALAVWNGTICAGGGFLRAGLVPARNLAAWDGGAWSEIGGGTDHEVYALASYGGELYAGGMFRHAGTVPANGLARWDGVTWRALDVLSGIVDALLPFGDELVVAGKLDGAGLVGGDVYRGADNMAAWNGADWRTFGSGLDDQVTALAASRDTLWAGGFFGLAGGKSAFHIARWIDGTAPPPPAGIRGTLWLSGPNPFAADARLAYALPVRGRVRLEILDLAGRHVATVVDRVEEAGVHYVKWPATRDDGRRVEPAVYLAHLEGSGAAATQKIVYVP